MSQGKVGLTEDISTLFEECSCDLLWRGRGGREGGREGGWGEVSSW